MKRSWLKNKASKTGLKEDLRLYKIQRNVVTELNESPKGIVNLFSCDSKKYILL